MAARLTRMSRNDAEDDLLWAMAMGSAVTQEQVDLAGHGSAELRVLADEVHAGAATLLPEPPVVWRSDAAAAYATSLEGARLALVSSAAILSDAADGLAARQAELRTRLDEQNAILVSRMLP